MLLAYCHLPLKEGYTVTTKTIEKQTLPAFSMGNQRELTVIRYGSGSAAKKVYIQAGLHADEAPGYLVMHHLTNLLDEADAAGAIPGEILLIPVANPIGAGQWRDEVLRGRFDYFDNTNFNRKHLDITEKVTKKIQNDIRIKGKGQEQVFELGRFITG